MAANSPMGPVQATPAPLHDATNIIAGEDFHTVTEPLSRTNPGFGTGQRQQRSLVLSGEKRDETSLRYGRPLAFVTVDRRQPRPAPGRGFSRRPQRDRTPGCAAFAGRPADPVHARCEPDEM